MATLLIPAASWTQRVLPEPARPQVQRGMGGIAGGIESAPVYDELKRPITAGGFVDSGTVIFQNITQAAGLSDWTHRMGEPEKKFIVEANGSGVGLIDYDNDGWLDIYLVNGSTFNALDGKEEPPHAALFHNNHDGTFTDVAEKAGVTLGNWSAGSAWGDYDGDGLLDLYVAGYVHFDRANLPVAGTKAVGYASCQYRGVSVNCGPRGLRGEPDHLFHNNGDGTFTDVTVSAGVEDKNRYYGLTAIFVSIWRVPSSPPCQL